MFTGIIEEVGTIRKVIEGHTSGTIEIQASRVLEGTRIGDSIAVNGVCLTVTSMQNGSFTADVMPETLRRSNLGSLRKGAGVNLERAMAADSRFGGQEKGSICIDGISLTVASVDQTGFKVSIIPHTGAETTLLGKKPGDPVNLENDIVGKYVERLLQPYAGSRDQEKTSTITRDFLLKYGF